MDVKRRLDVTKSPSIESNVLINDRTLHKPVFGKIKTQFNFIKNGLIMNDTKSQRIDYLDILRALACFMVVMVHAGDSYLFDGATNTFGDSSSFFLALLRPCVPLFIIMSSILLLPLKTDSATFFKKRFSRVLLPFLFWSILYVFMPLPGTPVFGGPSNVFTNTEMNVYIYNLMMIPFNFTGSNAHFWFIYTIIGLYLFMPVISPWLKQASSKSLLTFISIWGITLFFPYIRLWFPQIQGECDWNKFGMLYNFSGYLGYLVLGFYLHKHNKLTLAKSMIVGLILLTVGLFFTYTGFLHNCEQFLAQKALGNEDWKILELSIGNLTFNVALMTAGLFMIFQKITLSGISRKFFYEISTLSYGIFLVHYIVNLWISAYLPKLLSLPAGLEQFLMAVLIFTISYLIAKLISLLPKSKYLIG